MCDDRACPEEVTDAYQIVVLATHGWWNASVVLVYFRFSQLSCIGSLEGLYHTAEMF